MCGRKEKGGSCILSCGGQGWVTGRDVPEANSEGVEKGDLGPHLQEKRKSGSHTVLAVVRGGKSHA